MVNDDVPVFLNVTVCAALVVPVVCEEKVRLVGESVTTGAPTPVPVRVTVCGDPVELSLITRMPVTTPTAVGANVTEIVQLAPAATLVPQLLV